MAPLAALIPAAMAGGGAAAAGTAGSLALMEAGAAGMGGALAAGLPTAAAAGGGMSMASMLGLGATGLSAVGSLAQGNQQAAAAEYNAEVSRAEGQAAEAAAGLEETQFRRKADKLFSNQRALYGTSGIATEGSPLEVMADTAAKAELDALAIRYGGQVAKSRAYSQASMDELMAKQIKSSSMINAGTTILTGASRYFDKSGKWWS